MVFMHFTNFFHFAYDGYNRIYKFRSNKKKKPDFIDE